MSRKLFRLNEFAQSEECPPGTALSSARAVEPSKPPPMPGRS